LSVQFASIGTELQPDTKEVPVFIVYLTPVTASDEEVEALAKGGPIESKFLPLSAPQERLALKPALVTGKDIDNV
jgi:hypothetical protein